VERIGLDLVQEFYGHLLTQVVQRASPFLTKQTILDTVARAIPTGISQSEVGSVDARARILHTSKATYYRNRVKEEPDQ
jgi:hypothetical protein